MQIFSFGKKTSPWLEQIIPIALTAAVFGALTIVLFFAIRLLNLLPIGNPISLDWHWRDVIIGAAIYFKTSVDFAILIGFLMKPTRAGKTVLPLNSARPWVTALVRF